MKSINIINSADYFTVLESLFLLVIFSLSLSWDYEYLSCSNDRGSTAAYVYFLAFDFFPFSRFFFSFCDGVGAFNCRSEIRHFEFYHFENGRAGLGIQCKLVSQFSHS